MPRVRLFGVPYPQGLETRSEVPCFSPFLDNFEIEDGLEVHLGLEWVLERSVDIALRFGAWLDPDHQMQYNVENLEDPRVGDRFGVRFMEGEDELHWSGGVGVVLRRLQLDFAFDLSDRAQIFSLSGVYRWR